MKKKNSKIRIWQKTKKLFCFIYAWHILSAVGTIMLGYEIIQGYEPVEIPLLAQEGGLPEIAKEAPKAIKKGHKKYFIMRIGLCLVVFGWIIHIPKIESKIRGFLEK